MTLSQSGLLPPRRRRGMAVSRLGWSGLPLVRSTWSTSLRNTRVHREHPLDWPQFRWPVRAVARGPGSGDRGIGLEVAAPLAAEGSDRVERVQKALGYRYFQAIALTGGSAPAYDAAFPLVSGLGAEARSSFASRSLPPFAGRSPDDPEVHQ
jgi:hypothetical protein